MNSFLVRRTPTHNLNPGCGILSHNKHLSNAPHSSTLSPAIQEFVRFIEVSAGPPQIEQRPDEEAYQDRVEKDHEVYLCFRDLNDTYKRALSMLDAEHSKDDPLFLAIWMVFRLYAWGVYAVQNLLEESHC